MAEVFAFDDLLVVSLCTDGGKDTFRAVLSYLVFNSRQWDEQPYFTISLSHWA